MVRITRGRLDGGAVPETGERVVELARLRNLVVEQILSGRLEAPADYLQEHDEWVAVLHGSARLELAGEAVELRSGDWLLIPAATPHRLLWTESGTRWLALHLFPESSAGKL